MTPFLLFDFNDAEAKKSQGTYNTGYGSNTKNIVCGDQLCSETQTKSVRGSIAQQGFDIASKIMPSLELNDKDKEKLSVIMPKILIGAETGSNDLSASDIQDIEKYKKIFAVILEKESVRFQNLLDMVLSGKQLDSAQGKVFAEYVLKISDFLDISYASILTITPEGGPYNTPLKITGKTFPPLTDIEIRLNNHPLNTVTSSISGQFSMESVDHLSISTDSIVVPVNAYVANQGSTYTYYTHVSEEEILIQSIDDDNDLMTITGTHFPFNSLVDVSINGKNIQKIRTDGAGSFNEIIPLSNIEYDASNLLVVRYNHLISDQENFLITENPPTLSLWESPLISDPSYKIIGSNFEPSSYIILALYDADNLDSTTDFWPITVDENGNFEHFISSGYGNFVVKALINNSEIASIDFYILNTQLFVKPRTASPDTPIVLYGKNFPPNSSVPINLVFNDGTSFQRIPFAHVTTNSDGIFYKIANAPDLNGELAYAVFEAAPGESYKTTQWFKTTYRPQPSIMLSNYSGERGSTVTIQGNNFTNADEVMIDFGFLELEQSVDSTGRYFANVNQDGKFFAAITVPDEAPLGENTITVIYLTGDMTDASFAERGIIESFQVNP